MNGLKQAWHGGYQGEHFPQFRLKIIADVERAKPSLSPWAEDDKTKELWVHNTP